jgi:hypothetical protein
LSLIVYRVLIVTIVIIAIDGVLNDKGVIKVSDENILKMKLGRWSRFY